MYHWVGVWYSLRVTYKYITCCSMYFELIVLLLNFEDHGSRVGLDY